MMKGDEVFTYLTLKLGDSTPSAVSRKIIGVGYADYLRFFEIEDEDGVRFCKEESDLIFLKEFENKIVSIEI